MAQLSKIYALMGGNGADLLTYCKNHCRELNIFNAVQQYDPKQHDVKSKVKRPDKVTYTPNGQKDPVTGEDTLVAGTAEVARVPMKIQKYIINQKASFARGSGVILRPSREGSRVFERVKMNWKRNKTDFYLKEIAVRQMAETQVAVIYFGEPGAESLDDFRLRFKIVSPEKGDKLEPVYDEDTDDMIAFGRQYEIGDVTRYDLYLMNEETGLCEIYRYEGTFAPGVLEPNGFGPPTTIIQTPYRKLPVIYWEQCKGECDDTEEMIREMEFAFSDFLTQMGYSADPILFGKGTTLSLPAKGQAGKYVEGSADAELGYVTPDNATESRDLQFKMLRTYIFALNRAVLLDIDTMKELGDVSGAALERYLLDAYMEATDKQQGEWGIGVQRMINFEQSVFEDLENPEEAVEIEVVFTRFSVTDDAEKVALAMKANGSKPVVDHETSIAMAGLVDDPEAALVKIREESSLDTQDEDITEDELEEVPLTGTPPPVTTN